ncbi:MAG: urate hydroxylase PuuD [Gemmatimonadetes bacterium]|nr:urate hydroxylase PuuD [Gemmatimonadota bacterium]
MCAIMDAGTRELLDLLLRWVHVIAGIMWIGNSLLFNWLDRNLLPRGDPAVQGEAWLIHSGGFYLVEKRLLLEKLPVPLHWFKWQAYTTWLSGALLLIVLYYTTGGALLLGPEPRLSAGTASALGAGLLVAGWIGYDVVWTSPLARSPRSLTLASLAALLGIGYLLTELFSGRAAFLHLGALMGTLMAGNVAMRIMPAQRQLVAAVRQGQPPDPELAGRAKLRSIHNNYMTFPVIVLMVSSHFSMLHGHERNWIILGVLLVAGAGVRHFMNLRFTYRRWFPALASTAAAGAAVLYLLAAQPASERRRAGGAVRSDDAAVPFATARSIIDRRCAGCHASAPSDRTFGVMPGGVAFDTPAQIRALAERIRVRAIETRTMPPANKTLMTEEERLILRRWLDQGARVTDR